jgi:hypothetical protein
MAAFVLTRLSANVQLASGARQLERSFRFGAQGEDGLQVLWEDGECEENIGAAAVELTPDDLRDLHRAISKIAVQGARYPEHLERMTGR